ncbi:MAG TPA: YafY family protein [Candidatus Dormibacteraeota bacterium]|nr:YafY family protein [Candidatus Dormibacteraeota bacterium]
MLNTSARLLRVLTLLETRRDWSGAQLAERLEVSTRTVRSDVTRLRALGYPVDAAPGVAGGYRLGSGAALPPLLLDDEEAVAVAVALRSSAGGGVSGIEETSVRALVKLEQVFPSRLRRRVNALHAYTVAVPTSGPTVDAQVLAVIAAACRDNEVLGIDYRKHDGTETTRSVEPYRLVHLGRRWYLVAWDRDRHGWRTFRVDRLIPRHQSGPHFTPREPPAEDIAAYVTRSVRSMPMKYEARVTVQAPAATIAERVPREVVVEPLDDNTCLVHARSNSVDMLAVYLGLLDADFTVSKPPELVAQLEKLASRFAAAAKPANGFAIKVAGSRR